MSNHKLEMEKADLLNQLKMLREDAKKITDRLTIIDDLLAGKLQYSHEEFVKFWQNGGNETFPWEP